MTVGQLRLAILLGVAIIGLGHIQAWGANSVIIAQPDSTGKNAQDTIFIKLTNDVEIAVAVIPLVLRKINGDAFVKTMAISRNPADRLTLSTDTVGNPLGALTGFRTTNLYKVENGNCKNLHAGGFKTISTTGPWTSPSAALFVCGRLDPNDPNDHLLVPGTDSTLGSLRIIITTDNFDGRFEIDTTCTDPNNHLVFTFPEEAPVPGLTFTKGTVTVGTPLAVYDLDGGTGGIPKDYSLGQNYPNPFNAGTVINFATKVAGHVELDVFNILGQKVTTLVDQNMDYGQHAADWDGRDATGKSVPTGLYFYRLSTKDFTAVRKMLLIK